MRQMGKWIKPPVDMGAVVPVFVRDFRIVEKVRQAKLYITAMGVYEARINGERVSEYVLAPGWTAYEKRLQYQEYDVTEMLQQNNRISVIVGKGWYRARMKPPIMQERMKLPAGLLAWLEIVYEDGGESSIITDENWKVSESRIRLSEIYDGEIYDATFEPPLNFQAEVFDGPYDTLIPQEGEEIREQEKVAVAGILVTPKGERVLDFGQEVTGYVEIALEARRGDRVRLSFGEMLDKEGNFYNENYRAAKSEYCYFCRDGRQTWHPQLTFYGFRYARIDEFPGGAEKAKPENFQAIEVHSAIRRTGKLSCSDLMLNRLFDNVVWGQKDNFLDIPTDCPQRDERWGWTGDAQVFVRAACYHFDTEKFYAKWLKDLAAEQWENGRVGKIIPDIIQGDPRAAWGDAAVICPWEVYLAYGNSQILRDQFTSMRKWVDYITAHTTIANLWTGGEQLGDWLGLDAPVGSYKGASREDLIATAYYARSTEIVVKAGKVLGENIAEYEALYGRIVRAYRESWPEYMTQTECAISVHFRLAADCQAVSDRLVRLIENCGGKLQTGFIGTPYLLHALSDFGHADAAWSLLLRKEYPSWLYPITKGATTVWEHWDGIMENGDFWSRDMNSFNHYAYGCVTDWVYSVAAGIRSEEEYPGYERAIVAPVPDRRLEWLSATLETRHGTIRSEWKRQEKYLRYEISTPVKTRIIIDGKEYETEAGNYIFYGSIG